MLLSGSSNPSSSPFLLRGIGLGDRGSCRVPLPLLKKLGCNAIRTWGTDQLDEALLKECAILGWAVFAGAWIDRLSGDVVQAENVANEALRQIGEWQQRFPCIQGWILGNEVETRSGGGSSEAFWRSMANVCGAVKKALPAGTMLTTAVAEIGEATEGKAALIQKHLIAPGLLDFLFINSYGGAPSLPRRLAEQGFSGKWALGECGLLGQWETPKEELSISSMAIGGSCSCSHEQSSTEKAAFALSSFPSSSSSFLGSFAFFGGQKHEVSDTWYSLCLSPSSLGLPLSQPLVVADRLLAQAVLWQGLLLPSSSLPSLPSSPFSYEAALETISSLCSQLQLPQCFGIEIDGRPPRALHWKLKLGASFVARPALSAVPEKGQGGILSRAAGSVKSAASSLAGAVGRTLPSLPGQPTPSGVTASPPRHHAPVKTFWRLTRLGAAGRGDEETFVGAWQSESSTSRSGDVCISLPSSPYAGVWGKGGATLYRLYCFVSLLPSSASAAGASDSGAGGLSVTGDALSRLRSAVEDLTATPPVLSSSSVAPQVLPVATATALLLAE